MASEETEASSSLDPSFWPTHPTMERLWVYSLLTGNVQDMHWADSDMVFATADGEINEEIVSTYGDTCVGHRGSDVFPFGILENDTNGFKVRTGIRDNGEDGGNELNNREVLGALDPREDKLPYIYDNFKWTHCAHDGYDLGDAWGPWTVAKTSRSAALHQKMERKSGSAGIERAAVKEGQARALGVEARANGAGVGGHWGRFGEGSRGYPKYKKSRMMKKEQARQQRGRAD